MLNIRCALGVSITAVALLSANAFSATGRTAGHFNVSPSTGSAQYSIPIWTPPGPRGIQPHLALNYSNTSGIGSLGVGWSVSGLGAIARCNRTYAQDSAPAPIALATSDGYCLNGNRLRLTAGTYGTAGSTYQTEIADFSNITAYSSAGNGPGYFTVQGRDGLTYQYGYTDANGNGANSQVLANGSSTADIWLLSKVSDRSGNNMVVNYTKQPGTAVPASIFWTPTSSGASSYQYEITFNYSSTANVPQSSPSKYIGGTSVSNTELLSYIDVTAAGSTVRRYYLDYSASPTTGRNEIKDIQECADSARSNCFPETTITYQWPTAGVSSSPTSSLSSTGSLLTARYDLNGDGIPDLVYNSSGSWYVAFGSTTGYGTPKVISAGVGLIGNLTGGNEDGILTNVSGVWWYFLWNGSAFVGTSTNYNYDNAVQYQLADINGDGLPDLVGLYVQTNTPPKPNTASLQFHLNNSTGSAASFSSTANPSLTVPAAAQLQTPDYQYGLLRRYDFNGDGRDDLVIVYGGGSPPNVVIDTQEILSTGTGLVAGTIVPVSGDTYQPIFFANWNDDACTDYVNGNALYLSACNGTNASSFMVTGTVVAAMDWDGDGRTDLIVANGSSLGVYLSTGSGIGPLQSPSQNIPYIHTCQYVTLNANGDGLDDLGCWSQTAPGPLSYYLHNGAFTPPDLAISFTDGYGNSVKPVYNSIVQQLNYYPWNDQVFPYQNVLSSYYVASSATFSDPSSASGGTYLNYYYYSGGSMNLQGRGFMGFGAYETYDPRSGIWDTTEYARTFPETGLLTSDVADFNNSASQAASGLTSTPAYTTLDSTTNNQRYFPYISTSLHNLFEVGGSENTKLITSITTNNGTPDGYGNFNNVSQVVTDEDTASPYNGDTWTSTLATTITPNQSAWCFTMPTEVTVTNSSTAPGGAAITRTVAYTPDYTNCRQNQRVIEPSSSTYKVTEVYGYDSFGNLSSDTVTGIGMTARATTMSWGTTGQFPTIITNALGQPITLAYDPNQGTLTSQTDLNWTKANPLMTSWVYDGFARKTQENRQDGTYTVWQYNNCASDGGCLFGTNTIAFAQYVYNRDASLQSGGTTYFDTLDRPIMANYTLLVNGTYDRNEVRYDSLGRVSQQAMPCAWSNVATTCPYWSTFTYDALNRITEAQRPISASNSTAQTTLYGYAGRTSTIKDALNNTTTKITLVTGGLARSLDAKGYYQNFGYDAFGSLKTVTDSASNSLFSANYVYGIRAFKTSSTDMDLGTRSYTFDALGEVTAYTDAKSQSFSQTYNLLSQPLVRTEPDLTTTWTWGSSATSYNIGKLQSVTAASSAGTYTEADTYDSLTHPSMQTLTLPGDTSYTYTSTYSTNTGLLDTLQYPVSTSSYQLKLQYSYSNGILKTVSDFNNSGTVFWTGNTTNPRHQITQETLGNGVVTNRAFDAVTSWVGSIQSGVGSGAALQNAAFLYDYLGDVTQRQDNNQGLTENFFYDTDYRLDHSTLNGTLNLQMTYDTAGMGNIASRSDVASGAAWTYDPTRKHAVTQAGSSSYTYTYDANGNAITRNGSMVTWSSYNYPTGINSTGESVVFNYGPNRQRWKTVYTGSIGTETTYHIGSLLEKVANAGTIDYRHYIQAGNEQVAIYSRTSAGTNTLRYVLEDHLSSFAGIVSDSTPGPVAVDVNESFTAFGNRRSGSTWSGAPSSQDESTINGISRDGYTGETVLGVSMGLNHLNGRVEDAITGRFLSPDPNTPNPGNTQSWNRYSYVNNNPLTLMDPTGFFACKDSCNFPSGAYHWNSSLLQSVFGGEATSVSRTGIAGNTGDGGLGGIWASNFTGTAGSDATDTATLDDSGGIQIQPGASSADGTNTSDSSEPGNAASPDPTGASGSAQSQGPTQNAAVVPTSSAVADALEEIVVEGSRDAAVAFATTGVFVLGVLFPSNLRDGVVSARQNKPPNDARDPTGAKAPGKPGAAEGFSDPKGGEAWGQAPNGDWGWVDGDGNVWVPTGQGGSAHGGPHWDVNQPGGGYGNVYPGGKSRPGGP